MIYNFIDNCQPNENLKNKSPKSQEQNKKVKLKKKGKTKTNKKHYKLKKYLTLLFQRTGSISF